MTVKTDAEIKVDICGRTIRSSFEVSFYNIARTSRSLADSQDMVGHEGSIKHNLVVNSSVDFTISNSFGDGTSISFSSCTIETNS